MREQYRASVTPYLDVVVLGGSVLLIIAALVALIEED